MKGEVFPITGRERPYCCETSKHNGKRNVIQRFRLNWKHGNRLQWIYLQKSSASYRIFSVQYWMVHHLVKLIIIRLWIVGTILFDLGFGWRGLLSICWPWWTCLPWPRWRRCKSTLCGGSKQCFDEYFMTLNLILFASLCNVLRAQYSG